MRLACAWVALGFIAYAPAQALAGQLTLSDFGTPFLLLAPYAVVGAVILRHDPRSAIGWLLLAVGADVIASGAGYYAYAAYGSGHRLPLGWLALVVGSTGSIVAIACLALVLLLFPDGRAPSRRWRYALPPFFVVGTLAVASALAYAAEALAAGRVNAHTISPGGGSLLSGQPHSVAWLMTAPNAFEGLCAVVVLAAMIRQLVGYRRASGERRQQLKCLICGGLVCLFALAALGSGTAGGGSTLAQQVWSQVPWVAFSALPFSIGIAIHRHRLYEIDRIISRTLAYAILTALLAGTFVGLVVLTTRVLPFSSEVGVAASTLAAAALFNPLRVRIQRTVDRRFNRARYDAEATVAAFATRLREIVDLGTIESELLTTVTLALEPARATVWLKPSRPRHDGEPG